MMVMVPTPIVDVHEALMDQIAPMTSTTVLAPNVKMEAPALKDMVHLPTVAVLQASLEFLVTLKLQFVTQPPV